MIFFFRFFGSDFAFSFVSVGHIEMPGPILMTYTDIAGPGPQDTGNRTMLVHWNPGKHFIHLYI